MKAYLLITLLNVLKFSIGIGLTLAIRPSLLEWDGNLGLITLILPLFGTMAADIKHILIANKGSDQFTPIGNLSTQWIIDYTKYFILFLLPLLLVGVVYNLTQTTVDTNWFTDQIIWPVFLNVIAQTVFIACFLLPIELFKER